MGRSARGQANGRTPNRGSGRSKGRNYSRTGAKLKHNGMCEALGAHVFDYGPNADDQMQTTFEKIVNHVGTIYGIDISSELLNSTLNVLPEPTTQESK